MAEDESRKKPKTGEETLLYSYFRSSCSWRVRIVLAFKGIEYKLVPVSLLKSAQHDPEYVKLNSSHAVPTLVIDGHVLGQSMSILEYLEETRPEPSLLPKDPFLRQQVRQVCEIIASDIQPVANMRVLQKVGDDKKDEWAHYWIDWNFKALEQLLESSAGDYCVGDQITLADACLVPQVYNAVRYKVDLTPYPTISRVNANLVGHTAFKAAHAHVQVDCPPELKAQAS